MGKSKKVFTFEELNQEAEHYAKITQPYCDMIDDKDLQIKKLEHQILGYKAVVSYLEHQLGLGNSQ
jgi:hypothetical protein